MELMPGNNGRDVARFPLGLVHMTVRAAHGSLLFHTWSEAKALWDRLVVACPNPVALVLMPDHVHLLTEHYDPVAFSIAMRAYALWRNRRRGERGRVWDPTPAPWRLPDPSHARRTERYIHLNPCRWPHLVDDPLAWPFSTMRDAVGLVVHPIRGVVSDPDEYHRYVASDGDGPAMPKGLPVLGTVHPESATWEALVHAVSAVFRVPLATLKRPGEPRQALIAAARVFGGRSSAEIGRFLGLDPSRVRRSRPQENRVVSLVASLLGDGRFRGLEDGDLRAIPAWNALRYRR